MAEEAGITAGRTSSGLEVTETIIPGMWTGYCCPIWAKADTVLTRAAGTASVNEAAR